MGKQHKLYLTYSSYNALDVNFIHDHEELTTRIESSVREEINVSHNDMRSQTELANSPGFDFN